MKKIFILSLLSFSFSNSLVFAEQNVSEAPLALVYAGYGVCVDEDCAKGAGDSALLAGFQVKYIEKGGAIDPAFFEKASVWLQPGGYAVESIQSMGPALIQQLKNFIYNGGGFLGFCAGSFLSTPKVGDSGVNGLGIVRGYTSVFEGLGSYAPAMLKINWGGKIRHIYWEGGPHIIPDVTDPNLKILGRYSNGNIAAVETKFGKGIVISTGLHPEAPTWWAPDEGLKDLDGSDQPFVAELVKYASKKTEL